jgi:hypothetical protein
MKKYRVKYSEISEVEVERETESSVWINGSKSLKRSSYESYFDTYEDAFNHIAVILKAGIEKAESRLKYAKEKYDIFSEKYKPE